MFAHKYSFLGELHEKSEMNSSDPDLDAKVKKSKIPFPTFQSRPGDFQIIFLSFLASEKISENMHIVANDPSLAFYRIQEHVRKGKSRK